MIEMVPNWHPFWVHFAIALLMTGTIIYGVLGWRAGASPSRPTQALVVARWMIWLGVIASLASLLTGYWASNSVTHDELGHANMMVHRNWAIGATTVFALGAAWEFIRRKTPAASVIPALLFVAGTAALAVTGMEGAENVYEHGLGVQRLPDVSEHVHSQKGSSTDRGGPQASDDHDGHDH